MTYQEALRYLDSLDNYEKNPLFAEKFMSLERINKLVSLFGDPQKKCKTIHIAGTKGKGSTAVILSNILIRAGYNVGTYTSPHISDVRERIRINNRKIKKKDFIFHIKKIKEKLEETAKSLDPTFFEIYTLLAFNYFAEKKIDIGVVETGMGGRLDATNVIDPEVCIITPISFDHMKELGNRIDDIAREKADIIKTGCACISAKQGINVSKIIEDKCREKHVKLWVVGKDIVYRSRAHSGKEEVFDLKTDLFSCRGVILPLLGKHQVENCSTAIGAAGVLSGKGYKISQKEILAGVRQTKLSARCEVIRSRPLTILDTSHNGASARALKKTILRNFKTKRIILVLAIAKNKDIKRICSELIPFADEVVITKANTARAADPGDIRDFIKNRDVYTSENLNDANKIVKRLAKSGDIIVITGSFYLVAEARELFS